MKHKEIVRAWLDGAQIQYKQSSMGQIRWVDVTSVDKATYLSFPDTEEYRIKPKEPEKILGTVYWKTETDGAAKSTRVIVRVLDGHVVDVSLPCAADLMMMSK